MQVTISYIKNICMFFLRAVPLFRLPIIYPPSQILAQNPLLKHFYWNTKLVLQLNRDGNLFAVFTHKRILHYFLLITGIILYTCMWNCTFIYCHFCVHCWVNFTLSSLTLHSLHLPCVIPLYKQSHIHIYYIFRMSVVVVVVVFVGIGNLMSTLCRQ